MSIEQRAPSLNPRPDLLIGSPEREAFFDEIRLMAGSWAPRRGFSHSPERASAEGEGVQLTEVARRRITGCAIRIAQKAGLPEIADSLETEGLSIFGEEAARAIPSDFDPWGLVYKRVWDRLWNVARRERTKRSCCGVKIAEAPLDAERSAAIEYETHESRQFFRRELRPEPDERTIRGAVSDLPKVQRSIVEGLIWEGRTQADLAAELGISQGSVSRQYNQAKIELAEKFLQGS